MATAATTRSDHLLEVISRFQRVYVITHDNPDPDAIAAGWGIQHLIQEKLGKPTRLLGGGDIVRAENREMVKLLGPPIELVSECILDEAAAVVLVDCGLAASNHLLACSHVRPIAVIDHHETTPQPCELPFLDIRPSVAATATIAASYLRQQNLVPPINLATAIMYAIRTETRGGETFYTQLDRSIIAWLTEFANPAHLAEIESAPLTREYYSDLVLALQNTFIYDTAAICFLPSAEGAEIAGEVADLLIRCQGVSCVLCAALVGGDLLISVRTGEHEMSAAQMVQELVQDLGRGGGHQQRAGGKIPRVKQACASLDQLYEQLRTRWLAACNVDRRRGTRLVAKREIIGNL